VSVRAITMIAFTAAAVSMTLMNDRRLSLAFVEASPAPQSLSISTRTAEQTAGILSGVRQLAGRSLGHAALLAIGGIGVVALLPAIAAFTTSLTSSGSSSAATAAIGPPVALRAASGIGGSWEEAHSLAVPSAEDLGAAVLAGHIETQERWESLARLQAAVEADRAREAAEAAAAEAARQSQVRAAASSPARSYNGASGYPSGTMLTARITVYGCTGPGGGFCGGMASGYTVFEGAAACSYDLPFGTKLRIIGDATGRVYECLDRGALGNTWVDVFFYNTTEGINWASNLGGTYAQIEIVN
jgi:hypothetical protein